MKKIAPFLFLFLFVQLADIAFSQTMFQKIYTLSNTGLVGGAQQTTDGGYIIGGSAFVDSIRYTEFFIIKANFSGDTIWTKILGTADNDELKAIQQTNDGGYIIVGTSSKPTSSEKKILVIKITSIGSLSWAKTIGGYGSSSANCIQQTSDGGYIIGGSTSDFGGGEYLVKLTSTGAVSWGKSFSSSDFLQFYSLRQTTDGGYIISGLRYILASGTWGPFLLKTTNTGVLSWAKTYIYLYPDFVPSYSIQTSDGGYMLAGSYYSGIGGNALSLMKTNATGTISWATGYDLNTEYAYVRAIKQTSDGGYIVAGQSQLYASDYNAVLMKTSSTGSLSWTKEYGASGNESAYSIQQTTDGGYIAGAISSSFSSSSYSMYLFKTNSSGTTGCYENSISNISSAITPTVTTFTTTSSSGDTVATPIINVSSGIFVSNACLVGIEEETENLELTIFPNPNNGQFTIELLYAYLQKPLRFTVYNMLGEVVLKSEILNPRSEINLASQSKGIYFLQFQTEKGKVNKKFIIE